MPTYLSPGVYIEEVPSGPQPIAAAPTSVVAVLGRTRRGPVKDPTRITGWSDFERVFGGNAGDGFTAEAVYGFFENGGPAAWVVRVDPSVAGTWTVKDAGGTDSFAVTATSPGTWSSDLRIAVAPDTSGGSGTPYHAAVTAAVTVTAAATAIPVDSVAGVAVGDNVVLLLDDDAAAATDATVTAVAPGSLTVLKAGGGDVALAKGQVVAARYPANTTTITLAAGSGIRAGDLLLARTGDGTRRAWHVTATASQGSGLVVTVVPQGSAVAGAQFTERVARFAGNLTTAPTGPTVALGAISWAEDSAFAPTAALMTDAMRAWAADGTEGAWDSGASALRFPVAPPAGPITVEARLRARRFLDAAVLAAPTEADLLARYSFVPEGTSLRLKEQGAATTATVTRTATGFDVTTGSLAATFESAEFLLPDNATKGVLVRAARPPVQGDRVRFSAALILPVTAVTPLGGTLYRLGFEATAALDAVAESEFEVRAFATTTFAPLRFGLGVSGTAGTESHAGLVLDPVHPRYFARDGVVNGVSSLITVAPRAAGAGAPSLTTTPAFAVAGTVGLDVPPTTADVKKALTALEAETEPAMVICPDILTFTDPLLQYDLADAVVRHCEGFRRFAILDAPADPTKVLEWRNTAVSSTYASVFAPHLKIVNLDTSSPDRFRTVPPSGFVAGVIARTDRERGVHKAPGNERVSGIVGLSQNYTQRQQDALNPNGVNLIRAFPGRGTRVWGARNATDDVTWRYINVRRLFNFVETSVERGTQWVVFEPNTATTWLRIKASLEGFLDQLWRSGALAGATAEQAYRVRVGLGVTMTEDDIDLGLVITEVAIAPAKPAEFVVFRFSHKRLSA